MGRSELADRVGELEMLVRRAANTDEAVGAVAAERPDIVILDLEGDGVESIRAITTKVATPVLAVALVKDPMLVSQALNAGAAGVIASASLATELKDAVEVLLAGGSYLGKVDARTMVERLSEVKPKGHDLVTDRERDVLCALAEGMSARQIAKKLSVSERTVNTHIASVYRKLRVNNRVEAVRVAMRLSLVSSDGGYRPGANE